MLLTNNRNALRLYDWLVQRSRITLYSEPLSKCQVETLHPELVISYNYSYIIPHDVIRYMNGRIINLHISYLPWNRGFSPNIWSFIDNTPKGVTIHQINEGLDQGKILYQRECFFDTDKESFATSYEKLNHEIVRLFQENWEEIKAGTYVLTEQKEGGSYHSKKELNALNQTVGVDWNENIADFLKRYRRKIAE